MTSERLKQVEEIYHAAVSLAPGKRESFFNNHCGSDDNLRREVESLLAFENCSTAFLDAPPASLAAAMFAEQAASLIDNNIGRYRIQKLLGRGGMAEVYLAEDTKLHRQVALKLLPLELTGNLNRLQRFEREAQAVSALNHPHILTIHEFGAENDVHFIAMEYVEGATLSEKMKDGRMAVTEILQIAVQVASALAAAHQAGIVHRDIKPDNIMIRHDGIVKVLDFGIAKLIEKNSKIQTSDAEAKTRAYLKTNPGAIMGTADYMSPEQARGQAVDARSDIFSFGVVLYELLAGAKPFTGDNPMDVISSVLRDEPPPLPQSHAEVSSALEPIISKTLNKDCRERYQTAKDLLTELKDVQQELEFQKKLKHTTSASEAAKSSDEFNTRHSLDAKTLIYEVPPTSTEVISPARDAHRQATSSAEDIAGKVRNHKPGVFAAVMLLVVALVSTGYFTLFRPSPINSIAVLPFVNVGDDRSNDYLSDGLSENLINNLSRLPQLKVIARSSSFRFRGDNIDVQDAARKLGVTTILTGRVVRRAEDLQISVELINAHDNTRIWGEIYNRKVSGEVNVPEEIAHAVAEKLGLKLSGAQERQMAKRITNNPQAYQFHLNGVFFRRKNGAENIRTAIEYQNQAIRLDANFTLAYIELSINYGNLVDIGAMNPQIGLPLAQAAAEKALALDDTLADAYYNIARIRKYAFQWAQAEEAFKRAIDINPNLAAAHTIYAEYLTEQGRFDEALREIKTAQELDPLRIGLVGNEGLIYYFARRYDEAIAKARLHAQTAAENPFAHLNLANTYTAKGQYPEALISYQTSIALEETVSALIYLGRFYALSGKRTDATAILDKLKRTEKYVSPVELAILYTALGDEEQALVLLEQAYTARDFRLTDLNVEPAYDALRDDPRFQDLRRRVGFTSSLKHTN